MEAFRLSNGIMTPSPTNCTNIPQKFVSIRAASLDATSGFLVPYQREAITKTSSLKVVLQKARRENWVVKYRCSASGTEKCVATDRTVQRLIQRKRLAVFVSGGGSNFRGLHEATKEELIYGDISVLVTDKPGCGGAEYARDNQIPVVIYPSSKSSPEGLSVSDLVATLKKFEVDFILLAGFLKLMPVELVQAYPRSILNIHPSLLPAFGGKGYYGLKVHKAVIQSGARFSGPTIHFVDEQYDTGRILAQRVVPVLADDTAEQLAARVLHEEHELYVEVVSAICEDRIVWREDGVPLLCSKENQGKLY